MNDHDGCDDHDLHDPALQDEMALMPDGGLLCLCGRDPMSDEVAGEIAKAAALTTELGVCLDGCLNQAADAYGMISRNLKADPARRLRRNMHAAKQAIDAWHQHHMDEEQPFFLLDIMADEETPTLNWTTVRR